MGTQQANFRLRKETAELLEGIADKEKINKTEVVEYCVARYAADLDVDVSKAVSVMLRQIAATVAVNSAEKVAILLSADSAFRRKREAAQSNPRANPPVAKSPPPKAR